MTIKLWALTSLAWSPTPNLYGTLLEQIDVPAYISACNLYEWDEIGSDYEVVLHAMPWFFAYSTIQSWAKEMDLQKTLQWEMAQGKDGAMESKPSAEAM